MLIGVHGRCGPNSQVGKKKSSELVPLTSQVKQPGTLARAGEEKESETLTGEPDKVLSPHKSWERTLEARDQFFSLT